MNWLRRREKNTIRGGKKDEHGPHGARETERLGGRKPAPSGKETYRPFGHEV